MKRLLPVTSMFGLLLLLTGTLQAQESCICAHMPMYPVSGGWYHSATTHQADCTFVNSTGLVNSTPLANQNCATTCAMSTCMTLGRADCIPHGTFYFDKPLKNYRDLLADNAGTVDAKYKDYLGRVIWGSEIRVYRDYTFRLMGTVKLTRTVGTSPFYAAVYEMRHNTIANYWSYVGFEIESPDGSTDLPVTSQCNATFTCRNGSGAITRQPSTGLLQVRTNTEADYIIIRMHKIDDTNPVITPICDSDSDYIPSFLRGRVRHAGGGGGGTFNTPPPQSGMGGCQPQSGNCPTPCYNYKSRRVRGRKCCQ